VRELELTPAVGGWLHADWGDGHAWVRFGRDEQNKLTRITELHLHDPSPELLRRIPLKRIHAAATARGAGLVQLMLALGIDQEPEPGMLATPPVRIETSERVVLRRPAGRRLDDRFYRDVAAAYRSAVAAGLQPRKAMVEDTRAADSTVAAWVLEARRRGYLPDAEPGKVSA
jgi:hypothetical protein